MSWSIKRAQRLDWEESALARDLPQFHFSLDISECTAASGWERSPSYRHDYWLVVGIPRDYPEQMPRLYVAEPSPLYCYNGTPAPPSSHSFHTGPRHPTEGVVEVCHCPESSWDPSMTINDHRLCRWSLIYRRAKLRRGSALDGAELDALH